MSPLEDIRQNRKPVPPTGAAARLKWDIIEFKHQVEDFKSQVIAAKRGHLEIPAHTPDHNEPPCGFDIPPK
jgi:hypothetical protein